MKEFTDKQQAITYAYRYLLNREPEDINIVENNTLDWKELRNNLINSLEYKIKMIDSQTMPYNSLDVQGITYFFRCEDKVIPISMVVSGVNWASEDIANFIKISDQRHYKGAEPETGIFLDIGGNIGTTSIYCKKKLKSDLRSCTNRLKPF